MFYLFLKEDIKLDNENTLNINKLFSKEITPYSINMYKVYLLLKRYSNSSFLLKEILTDNLFALDENICGKQPHTFIQYINKMFVARYHTYNSNIIEIIFMLYDVYKKRTIKFHDEEKDLKTFINVLYCMKYNKPKELWNYLINTYDNFDDTFSNNLYSKVLNTLTFDIFSSFDNNLLKLLFNDNMIKNNFHKKDFYGEHADNIQNFYEQLFLLLVNYLYKSKVNVIKTELFETSRHVVFELMFKVGKKYNDDICKKYLKEYVYNDVIYDSIFYRLTWEIIINYENKYDEEFRKFVLNNINQDLLIKIINYRLPYNDKIDDYAMNIFKTLDFSKITNNDTLIQLYVMGMISDFPRHLKSLSEITISCNSNEDIKRALKIINYYRRKKIKFNKYKYKTFENMNIKLLLKLMYKITFSYSIFLTYSELIYKYYKKYGIDKILSIHIKHIKENKNLLQLLDDHLYISNFNFNIKLLSIIKPDFDDPPAVHKYIQQISEHIVSPYNLNNDYTNKQLLKILFSVIPKKYHYILLKNILSNLFSKYSENEYDLSIIISLIKLHLEGHVDLSIRSNYFFKQLSSAKDKYLFLENSVNMLLCDKRIKQQIIKSKLNSMRRP